MLTLFEAGAFLAPPPVKICRRSGLLIAPASGLGEASPRPTANILLVGMLGVVGSDARKLLIVLRIVRQLGGGILRRTGPIAAWNRPNNPRTAPKSLIYNDSALYIMDIIRMSVLLGNC